jgi:hypothetical protein
MLQSQDNAALSPFHQEEAKCVHDHVYLVWLDLS